MKKVLNKIINSYIFWILIICLIIYSPIIDKISYGHDIEFHLTNMEMLIKNLSTFGIGDMNIKIFGNSVANGFGYGTFLFYPCLSYIFTSIIGIVLNTVGVHSSLSISYTLILISFLSGISMYYFTKKLYKDNMVAFLCSVLYITSIYFLCDIYVRSAIAESLVFIFIPIIFSSLYELFYGNKYMFYLLFVIGYVGIFNSHLIMTIYVTIFIVILLLINFKKFFRKDIIKRLIIASFISLLVCSPYFITLLEHKFYGNYVVFDNKTMFLDVWLKDNSLSLFDYFYIGDKTSNGIKVYFNYVTLICFVTVIIYNKKIFSNDDEKKIYYNLLFLTIISMFVASEYFPWVHVPMFLKNIQFPWRICVIISFSMAILSGNVLRIFKNNNKRIILIFILISTIVFVINAIGKGYYFVSNIDQYNYNIGHQKEYMPVNVINNMDYYENRDNDIRILEGNGNVEILQNYTPCLSANINVFDDSLILELPRIYYLGYDVKLIDDNNKIYKIDYYENEKGFITIDLNKSGRLELTYKGSKLVNIFSYVSPLVLLLFIMFLIYDFSNKKRINLI